MPFSTDSPLMGPIRRGANVAAGRAGCRTAAPGDCGSSLEGVNLESFLVSIPVGMELGTQNA